MKPLLKKGQKKVLPHLLFWLTYVQLNFIIISIQNGTHRFVIMDTLVKYFVAAFTFYATSLLLFPTFHTRKKYVFLAIGLFLTCVAGDLIKLFLYGNVLTQFGFPAIPYKRWEFFVINIGWWFQYTVLGIAYYFFRRSVANERRLRLLEQEAYKKEMLEQAEKFNEEKTAAFVNLVHETKTPLTLINNYIEAHIGKNGESPELSVIRSNLHKLGRDMNNLFDLERFLKGFDIYDHDQVCNFSKILSDNVPLFEEYCRLKKAGLNIESKIEADVWIKADPNAVNSIINNLVVNAIKFTERGIILIELKRNGNDITFAVQDEGIGISAEHQAKVFEPYFQINKANKAFQGMGLGLPIVKKIVDSLGGNLSLISLPEHKGSIFSIVFHQMLINPGTTIETALPSDWILLSSEHVHTEDSIAHKDKPYLMVVEDNPDMLGYLRMKLGENYNIYTARNGEEAFQKLKLTAILPDLIISDVMMGPVDGIELANMLSQIDGFQHIPLLFLSAKYSQAERLKGLSVGAIDYMPKPFSSEELLEKVASVLRKQDQFEQHMVKNAFTVLKQLNRSNVLPEDQTVAGDPFEINADKYSLTPKEKEVARRIIGNKTPRIIGEEMYISEKTVNTHLRNIYDKLNVSGRHEMAIKLLNEK